MPDVDAFNSVLRTYIANCNCIKQQQSPAVALTTQICASNVDGNLNSNYGELERLKQEEQRLSALLSSIREQKLAVIRERPLNIGIIGFGRFGQFIAKSFTKYGNVVGTSRSDYTALAEDIGAKYIPMDGMEKFVVEEDLDVIVLAVSIVSFEDTVKELVPHLKRRIELKGEGSCPLIVDVLSVKEHPRKILLENLPEECDVLCSHPVSRFEKYDLPV
jgi:arogenate dehydrogenase (NADP+)